MVFKNRTIKRSVSLIAVIICICMGVMAGTTVAFAASTSLSVPASIYEFEKGSHYDFSTNQLKGTDTLGTLSITGDVSEVDGDKGVTRFDVRSGNATIVYTISKSIFSTPEEQWHLIEDKSKKVDTVTLDKNILSGAIILQTSVDRENWTNDVLSTDVFTEGAAAANNIYTTKDIQLQNGCYYRVIVAYEMQKQLPDGTFLFLKTDKHENKKVAEVYTFFASSDTTETTAQDTPKRYLGSLINTGKDNGFSTASPITNDKGDPHFNWEMGKFFVNGYTREEKDNESTPVFLKNVGDKVTLWFHLSQDINCLNGNENLSVSEDKDAYDVGMSVEQTNFKHGALIIRYTDVTGDPKTLPPYFDYLAANARTGADTRVQLFEEGDYEVVLDYEIKESTGPFDTIPKYHNYKISFKFKIRNGNCMVYPFDAVTKAELADQAVTENGFFLDMANSKYLTIDVTREVLKMAADGSVARDVRFNRPANDGAQYTEEGIYTFDVTNRYTGVHTTKTIYVGSSNLLKALALNALSVEALSEQLLAGATIGEDGTIHTPATPLPEPTVVASETTDPAEETTPTPSANNENPEQTADSQPAVVTTVQEASKASPLPYVVIGVVAAGAVVAVAIKKKKNKTVDVEEDADE